MLPNQSLSGDNIVALIVVSFLLLIIIVLQVFIYKYQREIKRLKAKLIKNPKNYRDDGC